MKATRYIENGQTIETVEWVEGLRGVLAVVREADGSEGLRTVDQLNKLDKVEDKPRTPHCQSGTPRKKRTPKRDDRWVECAGHMAAGTDPVTSAVASGLFDRLNKPITFDWGRLYGPKDLVPLSEALWWSVCTAALFWWVARFAI